MLVAPGMVYHDKVLLLAVVPYIQAPLSRLLDFPAKRNVYIFSISHNILCSLLFKCLLFDTIFLKSDF